VPRNPFSFDSSVKIIIFSILGLCPRVAAAQFSSTPADERTFSYLGFYSGMSAQEALAIVEKRDGSPFDVDIYCKPSIMAKDPNQRSCFLPSPRLRESRIQLKAVSFTFGGDTTPLEVVIVVREEPDFIHASGEWSRIVDQWEESGREVHRADWVQPQTPSCRHLHAWLNDRVERSSVDVSCVPLIVGERPEIQVLLHRKAR